MAKSLRYNVAGLRHRSQCHAKAPGLRPVYQVLASHPGVRKLITGPIEGHGGGTRRVFKVTHFHGLLYGFDVRGQGVTQRLLVQVEADSVVPELMHDLGRVGWERRP